MAHPTKQTRTAELTLEDLHAAWLDAGLVAVGLDTPPINMLNTWQLGELWGKKESATRVKIRNLRSTGAIDRVVGYRVADKNGRVAVVPHYHLKGT
jgi:hypothetical protein